MVPLLPAFGGVPAGPELIIILIIFILFIILPAVVIAAVLLFLKTRSGGNDERIEELEAEVERLREKVEDEGAE